MTMTEQIIDSIASSIASDCIYDCCHEEVVKHIKAVISEEVKSALNLGSLTHKQIFDSIFKALTGYEKRFRQAVEGVWAEERRILLANLKKVKKSWIMKGGEEDLVDSVLYPFGEMSRRLADSTTAIYIQILGERGQEELERLGMDIFFNMSSEEVEAWIKKYIPKFSENLEKVNIGKLREQLLEGIKAGEGVPKLARRINETYDNWSRYRSQMIARSETLRASNQGALEAYRQSGVVEKKIWITYLDDNTCEECEALDGEVVGIDGDFFESDYDVEGEGLMPPLHPQCRCAIGAYFEEKQAAFINGFWIRLPIKKFLEAKRV